MDIGCIYSSWSFGNHLTVNSSKTKAIVFGNVDLNLRIVINGSSVNFVDRLECLGVYLDRCLLFDYYIDRISFKVVGILRRLYSLAVYLPCRTRYLVAHALLMTHVLYGLEVVSGTTSYNITRLNRITNMIARYVYNVSLRTHISGYLKQFLGCSFRNFISYRNMLMFFKVIKSGCPVQLRSEFTFSHSSRNPQVIIPRIRASVFERSFLVRIARCWNYLPLELRLFSQSNNAFCLKLMRYLATL